MVVKVAPSNLTDNLSNLGGELCKNCKEKSLPLITDAEKHYANTQIPCQDIINSNTVISYDKAQWFHGSLRPIYWSSKVPY